MCHNVPSRHANNIVDHRNRGQKQAIAQRCPTAKDVIGKNTVIWIKGRIGLVYAKYTSDINDIPNSLR